MAEGGRTRIVTRPFYEGLKARYAEAVTNGEAQFTFDGDAYVTDYAKYLLQHIESKLPPEMKDG